MHSVIWRLMKTYTIFHINESISTNYVYTYICEHSYKINVLIFPANNTCLSKPLFCWLLHFHWEFMCYFIYGLSFSAKHFITPFKLISLWQWDESTACVEFSCILDQTRQWQMPQNNKNHVQSIVWIVYVLVRGIDSLVL